MTKSNLFLEKNRLSGFTLMETTLVVIVIGVIAAIALPRYTTAVERVRTTEGIHILTVLLGAQKRFAIENSGAYQDGTGPANGLKSGDLDVDIPVSPNFEIPKIFNNPAQVACINRNNASHFFCIDEDGVISCNIMTMPMFADVCQRLGY